VEIKVNESDIGSALKTLKRKLEKEGLFKEIKRRSFYEKPSEKKKRKRLAAHKKRIKKVGFRSVLNRESQNK
jgi:small subunit ribosomal protein S21